MKQHNGPPSPFTTSFKPFQMLSSSALIEIHFLELKMRAKKKRLNYGESLARVSYAQDIHKCCAT